MQLSLLFSMRPAKQSLFFLSADSSHNGKELQAEESPKLRQSFFAGCLFVKGV